MKFKPAHLALTFINTVKVAEITFSPILMFDMNIMQSS